MARIIDHRVELKYLNYSANHIYVRIFVPHTVISLLILEAF